MVETGGRPHIAIAHDYLTQRGGAERVVLVLADAFPDAPIYTTLYDPDGTFPEFRGRDIRTSWGNRIGPLRRHHRAALPLLPLMSSSILIDADVVIASSSGWSHGFRTGAAVLVYCYSPARWLYQPDVYLGESATAPVRAALRLLSGPLKRWDRAQAKRAARYVAISTVVQERIRSTYGIDAEVVPAPVPTSAQVAPEPVEHPWFADHGDGGFLLTVSRLLAYKNVEAVVRSVATKPDRGLVVVGRGPERDRLGGLATDNVLFLQDLTDGQVSWLYDRCAGLVAASHEDFGLTPLEAAAHGRPSAVLRAGGYLDTMVEGQHAVFFDQPTPEAIISACDELLASTWDEVVLRERAEDFSEGSFADRVRSEIAAVLAQAAQA